MDTDTIDIVSKSQPNSGNETVIKNIGCSITKPVEKQTRKICPLFLPKEKRKDENMILGTKVQKHNEIVKKKSEYTKSKKSIKCEEVAESNIQEKMPSGKKSKKRGKDIMAIPDMFLTKEEKEEKRRRLQSALESIPIQEKPQEELKKIQKVYSIFQKPSVRKQQLAQQADTSFKSHIHWSSSTFPICHFYLPHKSFEAEWNNPLPLHIPSLTIPSSYFKGTLPSTQTRIEEILNGDDTVRLSFNEYLTLPAVQLVLNTFATTHEDMRQKAIKYLQKMYSTIKVARGRLWIDDCKDGGKEMVWGMNEKTLWFLDWLHSFNDMTFDYEEGEDDWLSQEEYQNTSYLITGHQGKTSLIHHLAFTLGYQIIEVNNVDQEIANIVHSVQEATQSHVIKSSSFLMKKKKSEEKVFTKCPIILIDDLDVNIPFTYSFLPATDSVAITDRTTLDIYSIAFEKSSSIKQGYVKSVKQLIQSSKCPIVITTSSSVTEIDSLTSHVLYIPQPDPFFTALHIATITLAHTSSIPPSVIQDVCMQCHFDCRKAINCLQFISALPCVPSIGYSSYLSWPYANQQTVIDESMDFFTYSNYLHFYCKNHPTREITRYTLATITIHSLSPSIIPREGATVTLKGSSLQRIHHILLVGCEEGSRLISFKAQGETLFLEIPELPRGLYNLQFFTQDGLLLMNSAYQPWFGVCSLLVSETMNPSCVCSEDEFEESSKWKKGKSPVILLSELFVDEDLFEIPASPIEEEEHVVITGLSEQAKNMASIMEDLADNYEYLICENQLQTPNRIDSRNDDENIVGNFYYHPVYYWREREMAGNLSQLLYQSTLKKQESCAKIQSLTTCEKHILLDYYKQLRWEKIVGYLNRMDALSYLFFKRNWMDQLSSILLIQQIAKCDAVAKEYSRRGQQVFKNIETLLKAADRSLCKQFVEEFMNCADYDQLCNEEEIKEFWPSLYNRR